MKFRLILARYYHTMTIMNKCITCQKETNNPKFCSRSCSAKTTNLIPKRKLKRVCKLCGCKVRSPYTYCTPCFKENFRIDKETLTKSQMIAERSYQKHSRIREFARMKIKKLGIPLICKACNYDKHVEVCHKTAISAFSDDTPLSEINSPDNLVILCRNCHWEFDHNLITV